MQSIASRRAFVRHIAVGIPIIATTSLPSVAHGIDTARPDGMTLPPALDSMLRDMARIHNQLRRRRPTAADARAISAHVRLVATHQLQANRDIALHTAIRTALDRDGREALTRREPDLLTMRRELTAFGFDLPPGAPPAISRDAREAALDRLMQGGLTHLYVDSAMALESLTAEFEVAEGAACTTLAEMAATLEAMAAVLCVMAIAIPILAPDCFAATAVLATIKMMFYLLQC